MGDRTRIEWTDATWSPIVGCTPVSAGCANCYAARMAKRLAGRCGYPEDWSRPTFRESALDQPLRWKKPRRIFVCSMGDLFHPFIDPGDRLKVWNVMGAAKHTFLVLTKRPMLMGSWAHARGWPQNAWAGVTVENQEVAAERLHALAPVKAPVRFVSAEPLLGPLDLSEWLGRDPEFDDRKQLVIPSVAPSIQWVIVGGETGPGARPMHPDWVRSIRDQCQAAGAKFFLKSWGEWAPQYTAIGPHKERHHWPDGKWMERVGKHASGRLLDGREWNEIPEVSP